MSNDISSARPYAKALFTKAKKDNRIMEVLVWLEALTMVVADAKVIRLLADPRVGQHKVIAESLRALGDKLADTDRNFLNLLAENKRVLLMPAILAVYQQLQLTDLNKVAIEVASSKPLTEPQMRALQKKLEQKYHGPVDLTYQVDATLLGGVILRMGDKVIDGSVKGQLHQLNQSINEYA